MIGNKSIDKIAKVSETSSRHYVIVHKKLQMKQKILDLIENTYIYINICINIYTYMYIYIYIYIYVYM